MLRRQRVILQLLCVDDAALVTTHVQKLIFLLRQESSFKQDQTFYEFLPYKFGPFSFAAQREIDTLAAYGYVEITASSLRATALGKSEACKADASSSAAVFAIFSAYGKKPLRSLLKDVYVRYPWFASNSELADLIPPEVVKPKIAMPAVYTIGYESRSVDGFLDKLLHAGMRRIIDVRSNPVSRKYGFARSALAGLAGKLGIDYVHFPELGIPSSKRKKAKTPADFIALFGDYEKQTLPAKAVQVKAVAGLMKATPSVLLCMEKEPVDCHRSRLAASIAHHTQLSLVHL
jgi:hypothetical protein